MVAVPGHGLVCWPPSLPSTSSLQQAAHRETAVDVDPHPCICRRAVEAGSSRINFVPTHHWLPDETALGGIASFCYIDSIVPSSEATTGSNEYNCFPWSQARIQEYTQAMSVCFAEALRQGLTVYVR
jgi:hypothetical protein